MKKPDDHAHVLALQIEVDRVRVALVTLLIWMSGSAVSPLRHDEVQRLIHIAEGTPEQRGGPRARGARHAHE